MSSAQLFVSKGLQELVSHSLPLSGSRQLKNQEDKEKKIQKYVQYFMRILSARIQGSTSQGSESERSNRSNKSQTEVKQLIARKI